jgi:hypothetical protein
MNTFIRHFKSLKLGDRSIKDQLKQNFVGAMIRSLG